MKSISVHEKLREELREAILTKKLLPGQLLSSEKTLAEQYKISRPSVRRALLELEQANMILKRPGKGTFVKASDSPISPREIKTIGLDITEVNIGNPYYGELLSGMKKAASENGCRLALSSTSDPDYLGETGIDGVVFTKFPSGKFEKIEKINKTGIPVILLNRFAESDDVSYITVDFTEEAKKGVEYLIFLGHKKIGVLGASDISDVARWRKKGYYEAFSQNGLAVNEKWILDVASNTDMFPIIKNYLQKSGITALFVTTSNYIYPLCSIIYAMGIKVPDNLSVLCFDDVYGTIPYPGPKLSTVSMPLREMGERAVVHLWERLTGKPQILHKTFPAELTLRQSCAKPQTEVKNV